ncbi:hypothetical protein SAMN05216228_1015129 [Rhizobium tibeticum]|uniref:Uncharacterized protein n=1 Tax=Rhizobium tibeticum TaxID=501024 RepID=A0A1H8NXI8_9HYPH|nr:hypothetical protein [Rhizobium tibeticum]SEH99720.1 hypothetical protein RTCCBAU85039_3580 [Rhizobium tibeticum]SEO34359.1 hypothetical protein SAMN05216228_1015129 [Rhizobium tibeticum]
MDRYTIQQQDDGNWAVLDQQKGALIVDPMMTQTTTRLSAQALADLKNGLQPRRQEKIRTRLDAIADLVRRLRARSA